MMLSILIIYLIFAHLMQLERYFFGLTVYIEIYLEKKVLTNLIKVSQMNTTK